MSTDIILEAIIKVLNYAGVRVHEVHVATHTVPQGPMADPHGRFWLYGCLCHHHCLLRFHLRTCSQIYFFTGNVQDVLKTSTGETRALWKTLPDGWLSVLEQFAQDYAIWLLPSVIVLAATAKRVVKPVVNFISPVKSPKDAFWNCGEIYFAPYFISHRPFFVKRSTVTS